jgi:hypothetical protein
MFCTFRDIFSARLDSFIRETTGYLEGAIIGEIGNNTFDHNLDYDRRLTHGSVTYANTKSSVSGCLAIHNFGVFSKERAS